MKKCCALFLLFVLSLLCLFPLAVYADVLIEPNNRFYDRHRGECEYLGRRYYANGESGFVSVKKEPGANSETTVLENGYILNIMFTYNHNGESWGVTEIPNGDAP